MVCSRSNAQAEKSSFLKAAPVLKGLTSRQEHKVRSSSAQDIEGHLAVPAVLSALIFSLAISASSDRLGLLSQLHGGEPDGPAVPYGLIAILASAGALETAYLTMVSIHHHSPELYARALT